jgi:hypothetical protein
VIIQVKFHDWLELPTSAPTSKSDLWEKVPDLQRVYDPVLKRIKFLAGKGLTSMMVLFDFMSRRITLSSSTLMLPGYTPRRTTSRD